MSSDHLQMSAGFFLVNDLIIIFVLRYYKQNLKAKEKLY